jgi:hypothetical protein
MMAIMTARPQTMPTILKVTPAAALFAKKPLGAVSDDGVAMTVDVEPVEVKRKPLDVSEFP